ncbi:unnamed protein product [Protopolystoma xenopodis]|uniref:Uncharacterized protein n=1 Tax=Protopolystoma xenopodis TaxID=117903 RepID=A0A3S5CBE5_9PLAT|nr:unnamed protein product [Protopolystoma xenopodis]
MSENSTETMNMQIIMKESPFAQRVFTDMEAFRLQQFTVLEIHFGIVEIFAPSSLHSRSWNNDSSKDITAIYDQEFNTSIMDQLNEAGTRKLAEISTGEETGAWHHASSFTGAQVIRGHVRYNSTVRQPDDTYNQTMVEFKDDVILSCERLNSQIFEFVLPIRFYRIQIDLWRNQLLKLTLISILETPEDMGSAANSTRNTSVINKVINAKAKANALEDWGSTVRRITIAHLSAKVHPEEPESGIFFTLITAPRHGHLFVLNDRLHKSNYKEPSVRSRVYLHVGSQFTQADLSQGRLFYVLRRIFDEWSNHAKIDKQLNIKQHFGYVALEDEFQFRLHVLGARFTRPATFRIESRRLLPGSSEIALINFTPELLNRGTKVIEGGRFRLGSDKIWVQHRYCEDYRNYETKKAWINKYLQLESREIQGRRFLITITRGPRHGRLILLPNTRATNPKNSKVTRYDSLDVDDYDSMDSLIAIGKIVQPSMQFTLDVIAHARMMYIHDGSETRNDSFGLSIACYLESALLNTKRIDQNNDLDKPDHYFFELDPYSKDALDTVGKKIVADFKVYREAFKNMYLSAYSSVELI